MIVCLTNYNSLKDTCSATFFLALFCHEYPLQRIRMALSHKFQHNSNTFLAYKQYSFKVRGFSSVRVRQRLVRDNLRNTDRAGQ